MADHPQLAWLNAQLPDTGLQRSLVLCDTAAGAGALRHALTSRRGGLLGIEFVTSAGLAKALLRDVGQAFVEDPASPLLERARLKSCLGSDPVSAYAHRFPGALHELWQAIQEISSRGESAEGDWSSATRILLQLSTAHQTASVDLGGRDRWMAQAIQALARATDRKRRPDIQRILQLGMAEPMRDLQVLLQLCRQAGIEVHTAPDQLAYPEPERQRVSAADPVQELRSAAAACLDAAASGVPYSEMVCAVPRISAYAARIAEAFRREGVPFHAAADQALIHTALGALCMQLAQLWFGTAPRSAYLAWLTAGQRHSPLSPEAQLCFDRLSRQFDLHGRGPQARAILAELRSSSQGHPEAAAALATLLDQTEGQPARQTHRERSAILCDLWAAELRPLEDAQTADELRAVHQALSNLPELRDGAVDAETFCQDLEDQLQQTRIPLPGNQRGGVEIVEFRAALAMPCQFLQLLGLSAGSFPGPGPNLALLDDDQRQQLGLRDSRTHRDEARDLLRRLLHHAPRMRFGHSRRDNQGREQELHHWVPALLGDQAPEEQRLPSHPQRLAAARITQGICPPDLCSDHLAFGGHQEADSFAAIWGSRPARVLANLDGLEDFGRTNLSRDGDLGEMLGAELIARQWRVTSMDILSQCPQRFWLEQALPIRPLPAEADPLDLPRDRVGTLIHKVVELAYQECLSELQTTTDPTRLQTQLCDRARALLHTELRRQPSTLRFEFPRLHALIEARWRQGLEQAIAVDLALMADDHSRPLEIEASLSGVLELGDWQLQLTGQADRIDRLAQGGLRVLDYKTGENAAGQSKTLKILRGEKLQLLIYGLLLRQRETEEGSVQELEVRALRPDHDASEPEVRHPVDKAHDLLAGRLQAGTQETLQCLAHLLARGALPFRAETRSCTWCKFRLACRRHHPPSRQRVQDLAPQTLHNLVGLGRKVLREPLLGLFTPEDQA